MKAGLLNTKITVNVHGLINSCYMTHYKFGKTDILFVYMQVKIDQLNSY